VRGGRKKSVLFYLLQDKRKLPDPTGFRSEGKGLQISGRVLTSSREGEGVVISSLSGGGKNRLLSTIETGKRVCRGREKRRLGRYPEDAKNERRGGNDLIDVGKK